ncbi:MAG: GIY-YIG nuclease family protein [Candidatus Gracilibacteria bacterium]
MTYAYILASEKNGTLYTGVTIDLERRLWEHKQESSKALKKNTESGGSCILNIMNQ